MLKLFMSDYFCSYVLTVKLICKHKQFMYPFNLHCLLYLPNNLVNYCYFASVYTRICSLQRILLKY